MASFDPTKLARPITTGGIAPQLPGTVQKPHEGQEGTDSFLSILQKKLETDTGVAFSKHAVSRVAERQIDVSRQNLERLNQGVQLAQQKGLRDALILIDQNAYIVNAAAGKVITVDGQATEGSVFTNIDGTVIV